jgi:hypothetical protein
LFSDANVAGVEKFTPGPHGQMSPPPQHGIKDGGLLLLKITPNFSFAKFIRVGERDGLALLLFSACKQINAALLGTSKSNAVGLPCMWNATSKKTKPPPAPH